MSNSAERIAAVVAMVSETFPNVSVAQALSLTTRIVTWAEDELSEISAELATTKWQADDARDMERYWQGVADQRQREIMDRNSEIGSLRTEISRLNALDAADLLKHAEGMEDDLRPLFPQKKIMAIKALRAETNCGLKEAKDTIEALFDKWAAEVGQ